MTNSKPERDEFAELAKAWQQFKDDIKKTPPFRLCLAIVKALNQQIGRLAGGN